MIECEHIIKMIPRPDTPHFAEKRCVKCNKFLGWQSSPTFEGTRKQSTKYDIEKIMNHKQYTEEPFCFFCGRKKQQLGLNETLTIDHIKPIRDKGKDELTNLQILYTACHKLRHWTELYTNKHLQELIK